MQATMSDGGGMEKRDRKGEERVPNTRVRISTHYYSQSYDHLKLTANAVYPVILYLSTRVVARLIFGFEVRPDVVNFRPRRRQQN